MSDLLPWATFVESGIVLNKDGSIQQTLSFRGVDFTSSSIDDIAHISSKLNNACRRFGSGWVLYIESSRYKTTSYFNQGNFPCRVSKVIDEERRVFFEDSQQTYASTYFFTLQYFPPETTSQKTTNLFIKKDEISSSDVYHSVIEQFKSQVRLFYNLLDELMYNVQFLSCDETLTYLHNMVSDKRHHVSAPPTPNYFDRFLCDTHLENGLSLQLGKHHLKMISIIGYPSSSSPALMERLNSLPVEYRWVSRYIPLDKLEAEQVLKSYRRKWFAKRKTAFSLLFEIFSKSESTLQDNTVIQHSKDADEALQELMADYVSYGYLTITITLINEELSALETSAHEVERIINSLGFTSIKENINSLEAWLSSIPGHVSANIRMPLLHSLNLCHLLPICAPWSGSPTNKHLNSSALMLTQTSGCTPFYFNNHVKDVGHQMILGPTGSGKSILLNTIALQFLRYSDAQVFIFDKGLSFLVSTLCVGGKMYSLGSQNETDFKLHPLIDIDTEEERSWCHDWLLSYCIYYDASAEETSELWKALSLLADLPREHRCLSNLCPLIQNDNLRTRLKAYAEESAYGGLFDGSYQGLSENNWLYFEVEQLMRFPKVIPAVLMYLFHILEKRFTGKPTLLILDEAWLFFDDQLFSHYLREWLKTLRKKNVSVVFATQSVDDLLNSDIASSLIESCPSRVFLANKRAEDPHIASFYESLGLNKQQLKLITSMSPRRDYYYQSFEGNAIFDLCLGPISLAFIDSKNMQRKKKILELYNLHGYPKFIPYYLQEIGMNEISDIFSN